jgi:FtsP/CotA-like multicopper oxidase with cupredoxin domain
VGNALAVPFVQCPGDEFLADGTPGNDAVPDPASASYDPNVRCVHLSSGDGYITLADGRELYIFGFGDLTGLDDTNAMANGALAARLPGPPIVVNEGEHLYLSLTNVGMLVRPDLADPHTVHFHGFPNASSIFDGLPESGVSVNMGSTLTYFYNLAVPGTYFYHCHVEAAEHMQMGMNGNLYVKPAQNQLPDGTVLNPGAAVEFTHTAGNEYAYNDTDGTTFYDVEYALQLSSLDGYFHDASETVQPLPFAEMSDDYAVINGRGYPDTALASVPTPSKNGGIDSQLEGSLVTATQGDRILLRISNVSITQFFSIRTVGLDMEIVGNGGRQLRGPDLDGPGGSTGTNNYYTTNTISLGGGEAMDVIIDTAGITPGTYFLYTTNLNYLSNGAEDFGGLMTEIVIN